MSAARLAISVLCLSFALPACGGGDGEERGAALTTPSGPSGDYLTAADAICYSPQPLTAATEDDPEQAAALVEQQASLREAQLSQLEELSPPGALAGAMDEFLAAQRAVIGLLRDQAEAARAGDFGSFDEIAVEVSEELAAGAAPLAEAGSRTCAQPISAPPARLSDPLPGVVAQDIDAACEGRPPGAAARAIEQVDVPSADAPLVGQLARVLEERATVDDPAEAAELLRRESALAARLGLSTCGQGGTADA